MSADRLPTIAELAALVEARAGAQNSTASLRAAVHIGGELTDLGDALVERFVVDARAAGLSWTEIGEAFGTSKQAAQQRYGATIERWPGRWTPAADAALDRAGEEA